MKKILSLIAFGPLATFAADGDSTVQFDGAAVNTAISGLVDQLSDWVGAALPIVLGVVGAFLAFWAVKILLRVLKSLSSRAS